jgi:hypothetical protein
MTACGIARQVAGTPRLPGAATRAPARQADHRAVTPVGLVCPASSRASTHRRQAPLVPRQWRSASPKLVLGAHSCGRRAGPRLTHGHETKTERATASDRRGAGPAPAAATQRDSRGAHRRRSRPCRRRCVGRSRLGTGPGGRSARRSAVPRPAKRPLRPGRCGERPKPHRPLSAPASAAAPGRRDDSHPSALAHRSPIA